MSSVRARLSAATAIAASGPLRADRDRPVLPPLPRDETLSSSDALIVRFTAELEKLTGKVHGPTSATGVAEAVVETLAAIGANAVIGWDDRALACPGLADALLIAGVNLIRPEVPSAADRQSTLEELAQVPVGLTGVLAGTADTGSIIVASGPGRARVASLLTPTHLAILPVSRLHATLADWLDKEFAEVARDSANVVVITGPSRTADIELVITLGVHGPKEIHVFLYKD